MAKDTIQAFAIHTIHRRDEKNALQVVQASVKGKPSVFGVPKDEFLKLERQGAVRVATKEEVAVAKAAANRETGADADDEDDNADSPSNIENGNAGANAPSSGAAGDPNNKPAGKKPKDDDI